MEKTVVFRDRQELQSADLNNIQAHATDALEHLVLDSISENMHYTGGDVSAAGATEIDVAALRLYKDGIVYASEQTETLNLFQYLPLTTKKVVAVVAWGDETDTDVQPRDFLIDLTTGQTQPQAVAMQHARIANINLQPGVESVDPQPPAAQSGTLVFALVYLTPSGIERIEMQTDNLLPNSYDQQLRVIALEDWQGAAQPRIDSIATDLSALAQKTDAKADRESIIQLANDISALKQQLVAPSNAVATTGNYGDSGQAGTGESGYAAIVRDGVLFPEASGQDINLALFNPIDPAVSVDTNNLALPVYEHKKKVHNRGFAGDVAITSYQSQALTIRKFKLPNHMRHYGPHHNHHGKWYARHGWDSHGKDKDFDLPNFGYAKILPKDLYELEAGTNGLNGSLLSQTVLISNAMWLTKVGLFFTQIAASGDVTLIVSETSKGKPDLDRVLTQVNIAQADLLLYPAETEVVVPPVFLEGGKYYAITLVTQGDHHCAVVNDSKSSNGTLFYGQDGNYSEQSASNDLMFVLYAARFDKVRTVVSLQALSLAGGLSDIRLEAPHIIPKGCAIHYEIQPTGAGAWYAFGDSVLRLATLPNLVNIRAVLLGTRDLAPGIKLSNNALHVSRPADAMVFWSTERTVASTTQVVLSSLIHNWDNVNHTFTPKIVVGGTEYAASVTTYVTEDGARRYKHTFTVPATTAYKIKVSASKTSGAQPFTIAELIDATL